MSYTPTIYVDYNELKELKKNKKLFPDWNKYSYDSKDEDDRVMYEIQDRIERGPCFKFKGIDIAVLCSEFSSFNFAIREKLKKLKIDYAEYE